MAGRVFLDTNIFIYEFDSRDRHKQQAAQALVAATTATSGIISYQVIQEFLNVMVMKAARRPSRPDLLKYVHTILWPMCEVFPSPSLYDAALLIREQTGWGFFDSLIVSAALTADCEILYSEDLQAGRIFRGVEIRNPFA